MTLDPDGGLEEMVENHRTWCFKIQHHRLKISHQVHPIALRRTIYIGNLLNTNSSISKSWVILGRIGSFWCVGIYEGARIFSEKYQIRNKSSIEVCQFDPIPWIKVWHWTILGIAYLRVYIDSFIFDARFIKQPGHKNHPFVYFASCLTVPF